MKKFRLKLEDKIAVYHKDTQIQNVRMKETGVKRKKRQKDPRPTDFSRPSLKIHEEDEQHIYHVTHTKHIPKIQKSGIMPMKTSNWVKAGDKERYGGGEVYAFSHKADAHAWAGRMDWAHNQTLGSGKISIITAHRPKDRKFEVDDNDPLSQAGRKGDWLKTHGSIEPHHIVSVEKYMPKKLGEDKVTFDKPKPTVKLTKGLLGKVRRASRAEAELLKKQGWKVVKEGDVVPFTKKGDLPVLPTTYISDPEHIKAAKSKIWNQNYTEWKERKRAERIKKTDEATDRIGKQTPSAESIAKKHNKEVAEIQAQIDKGIKVEREHTDSDAEAHEIARDHLDEFPDYYDRLDKMEKKAKKDMKEAVKSSMLDKYYKRMKNDPPVPSSNKPSPVPIGYERVKDGKFNILRRKKTNEGYDPQKSQLKNRIEAHKNVAKMMADRHGAESQQAAFHRALVKRMEKELGENTKSVDEAVKKVKPKKQSKKSWQADARLAKKSKHPDAIRKALKAHALRNEEVANSVGGGMSPVIGGEGNIHGTDPLLGKPIRRRKFAGKQVFVVDPTTYHKAYLGKRKYEHYEKYLEDSPMADEIRAFGRKYWDEPIIIENEQTGAMV
jgi:hypothetical protein